MFHYTRPQIALHWLVAVLLAFQYLWNSGMSQAFRALIRQGQGTLGTAALAHLIAGVAILALVVWRLALRRNTPQPPKGSGLLDRLAQAVHWLLYAVVVVIALTGLVAWFGASRPLGEFHEVLTNVLLALIGLHMVGALYHQFVLKDRLMERMRPGGSVRG